MKKRFYRFLIRCIDKIVFRLLVWRHNLLFRLSRDTPRFNGGGRIGMRKTILR